MAYTKTNWQDNVTPASAQNMNKIEQGIEDAHNTVDTHVVAAAPHSGHALSSHQHSGGDINSTVAAALLLDAMASYSISESTLPNDINISAGMRLDFINDFTGGGSGYKTVITFSGYSNNGVTQLAFNYNDNEPCIYIRTSNFSENSWGVWTKLWTAANDGAGSGLDADTVDGKHASDVEPVIIKGEYAANQSIPVNTAVNISIPLGTNRAKAGRLVITKSGVANAYGVDFNTDIDACYGHYIADNSTIKTRKYHAATLPDTGEKSMPVGSTSSTKEDLFGGTQLYLAGVYISGSNLILRVVNEDNLYEKTFNTNIMWEVWG